MNDFDFLLRRTILDGSQFDNLIPASECQKIDSGNGNTELSMEWIKEMSLEFHPQMQKVAKVLQKQKNQNLNLLIFKFQMDRRFIFKNTVSF